MNLKQLAEDVRGKIIKLSYEANSAHLGSSLSCVEILTACYALKKDKLIKKLILSKGHAAMGLYSTASVFGDVDDSHLNSYLQNESKLWGHPSYSDEFSNFIDWSTGSLGHGLPVMAGFALKEQILTKNKCAEKFVAICSDGEWDEGSNWESLAFAGHHQLRSLVCLMDYNKIQSLDFKSSVCNLEPLEEKIRSFHWDVVKVDGHDVNKIYDVVKNQSEKPLMVICDTIKGKGIPRIENTVASHYKPATEKDLLER